MSKKIPTGRTTKPFLGTRYARCDGRVSLARIFMELMAPGLGGVSAGRNTVRHFGRDRRRVGQTRERRLSLILRQTPVRQAESTEISAV